MIEWHERTVKVDELKPYEKNPRKISPKAYRTLLESLKKNGYHQRIIATLNNEVIGGHMRIKALRDLGMKEVTILTPDRDLTEEEFRRILIQDNLPFGEFDYAMLANDFDIDELKDWGFPDNLLNMMPKQPFDDEKADNAPALQEKVITRTGDLWLLGSHRLLCGDSASPEDLSRLMDGQKADMIFTDPPYGVSIGSKNKFLSNFRKGGIEENIENDTLSADDLYKMLLTIFKNMVLFSKECCCFYVCSPQGGELGMMMMMMMMHAGLKVRHVLNWVKNHATFSLGRLDYDYQHEPILFTWLKSHKKIMGGDHKTSCWFIDKPQESKLHPTMKPVALPRNAILNSSDIADIVVDLFGGAGSTLLAAETTGRINYTMEIDPHYIDVICRRYMQFSGKSCILESTSQTFAEVEQSRS